MVAEREADDVRRRHHEVAAGEEDDGPLGVLKPRRVDEEGEDGEERGGGANDGPKQDPIPQDALLFVTEKHAMTRGGAAGRGVTAPVRRTHVQLVTQFRRGFEVDGALEVDGAVVRRRRRRTGRRMRIHGFGRVFADAKTLFREILAAQALGPLEAEFVHERLAAVARGDAEFATGRDGVLQHRAHGRVHGAQEELQVFAALHFDEWEELVNFQPGVLLLLMIQQVGHNGHVVLDVIAQGDGDGFAAVVLRQLMVRFGRIIRRVAGGIGGFLRAGQHAARAALSHESRLKARHEDEEEEPMPSQRRMSWKSVRRHPR